jgi:site-specific recombinase XerD
VLEHFERHLGKRRFIEAITCSDIDDYKTKRTGEKSRQHDRKMTPRTINFEVSVLRTLLLFLSKRAWHKNGESLHSLQTPKGPIRKSEEKTPDLHPDLNNLLKDLPRRSEWVFACAKGRRQTHLLRGLKAIAQKAGAKDATLHKFRRTHTTRLLESGADIVQKLLGPSDIDTTRRYLNPDEQLKRDAVNRLTLTI